jgi:hypothetical protein
MIRREIRLSDGRRGWLLISQRRHARLSRLLAERCAAPGGSSRSLSASDCWRRELQAAIEHHDDGWRQRDAFPPCDPHSGTPRNFDEWTAAETLAIWSASIDACRRQGLLAGATAAAHFLRLLHGSERLPQEPLAIGWQQQTQTRRREWEEAWIAAKPQGRSDELADRAAQWLSVFDAASLWLCLQAPFPEASSEPSVAWELDAAGSLASRWAAAPSSGRAAETPCFTSRACVDPWLFDAAALALELPARIVPQAAYGDARALWAASRPATLRWRLSGPTATAVG